MSDVSISYKGAEIASLDASGTKRLLTSGKYCEDDIEVAYTKPSGGGGEQTISFLDWENYTAGTGGGFNPSNTRIVCKHGLYKCRSISIPTGFEIVIGAANFPRITTGMAAGVRFVGFWTGSGYINTFAWHNSPTIDLTAIEGWDDYYFVMLVRNTSNTAISPSEGNNVVVSYNLSDGAYFI